MTRTHAINKAVSRSRRSDNVFYVMQNGHKDFKVVPESRSIDPNDSRIVCEVHRGRVDTL